MSRHRLTSGVTLPVNRLKHVPPLLRLPVTVMLPR